MHTCGSWILRKGSKVQLAYRVRPLIAHTRLKFLNVKVSEIAQVSLSWWPIQNTPFIKLRLTAATLAVQQWVRSPSVNKVLLCFPSLLFKQCPLWPIQLWPYLRISYAWCPRCTQQISFHVWVHTRGGFLLKLHWGIYLSSYKYVQPCMAQTRLSQHHILSRFFSACDRRANKRSYSSLFRFLSPSVPVFPHFCHSRCSSSP